MASFVQDLWESIFTPGPTASLMLATHITFAALQTVLFVLLLATYSIHFVILSFLCAGLWWAITWFARELQASQQREEQAERDAEARARKQQRRVAAVAAAVAADASADSETETEVEGSAARRGQPPAAAGKSTAVEESAAETRQRPTAAAAPSPPSIKQDTPVPPTPPTQAAATMKINQSLSLSGSRSGVSTEDEWEKVSEGEHDKDK